MNETHTRKLFTDFPNLYRGKNMPMTKNLMCFGFACGDGWFDIIYRLSAKLEKRIVKYKKDNKDDPEPPHAVQVKEKFGGLCFYMSGMTDEMRDLISEAEEKCYKTCEECGMPGKVRNTRWVRVLCENHFVNR